jgi:hypothetical protein
MNNINNDNYYIKEGDTIIGIDRVKLEDNFKTLGHTQEEAKNLTSDTVRNLQEKNDRLSFHGNEIKFNNKPGENNNIMLSDLENAMKVALEKLQQEQVTNEAKDIVANNSEVSQGTDGKTKATFNLKNLRKDLITFATNKMQEVSSAVQGFGERVKQLIADVAGKIADLIRNIFGSEEKPAEANKTEPKVENKNNEEPLKIETSKDGDTATIEAKQGMDAKAAAKAIRNIALTVAKGAANIVGQAVGMVVAIGKELAAEFKAGYEKRSGTNNNLDIGSKNLDIGSKEGENNQEGENLAREFTTEVARRNMNSQQQGSGSGYQTNNDTAATKTNNTKATFRKVTADSNIQVNGELNVGEEAYKESIKEAGASFNSQQPGKTIKLGDVTNEKVNIADGVVTRSPINTGSGNSR